MKLVSRFSGFLLLLFFAACQQNDVLSEAGEPRTASVPHQVSVEAALGELSGLLAAIDPPTRGGGRTVAAVGTVTCGSVSGAGTRCAEQPEGNLVHIVQFSEGGYAVLGADDRLPSVIAVVDEGGLTTEAYADMVRNGVPEDENGQPIVYPGIVFGPEVYEQLGYDPADSGLLVLPQFNYGPWTTLKCEALIQTKWDQGSPYNVLTPQIDGQQTLVGCVAVAVGQIMAYKAYGGYGSPVCPVKIAGYTIDWDKILKRLSNICKLKEGSIYEDVFCVATLLKSVGVAVGMNYGVLGSGAPSEHAAACLAQYGYSNVSLVEYDFERVCQMLDKKYPVYISATDTENHKGHAWVIDGYTFQWRTIEIVNPVTNVAIEYRAEYRNLLHCNFGWGGSNDGYYLEGIFDLRKGQIDVNDNEYFGSRDRYYQASKQIITYTGYYRVIN